MSTGLERGILISPGIDRDLSEYSPAAQKLGGLLLFIKRSGKPALSPLMDHSSPRRLWEHSPTLGCSPIGTWRKVPRLRVPTPQDAKILPGVTSVGRHIRTFIEQHDMPFTSTGKGFACTALPATTLG
jgi:hypothetical protein